MFEKDFNLMVGRNLKRIRKERNLSVYKLAKELNRSVDAFYAYEEGTRTVPFQIIMELSKFYNVSIDELIKNKVTTKRTKAVSFEIANSDSKDRVVIDSENDNIVFYKVDEWTYKYFLKCIDITLNKEVLIIEGVRENWIPKPIEIIKNKVGFINQFNFRNVVLANAFMIENIPYYWKKGKTEIWKK